MDKQDWNHNNHYHNWILYQLPARIECAIDVGCGEGEFSRRLASVARHVDAIDYDADILKEARKKNLKCSNIKYLEGGFLETRLAPEEYDSVVSIASLHHMVLPAALEKMKWILKPGGTLVILGLYRDSTFVDFFWSGISKVSDVIIKIVFNRKTHKPVEHAMKIVNPADTIREIKLAASDILPNMKMRRHLFWRYSITWTKQNG